MQEIKNDNHIPEVGKKVIRSLFPGLTDGSFGEAIFHRPELLPDEYDAIQEEDLFELADRLISSFLAILHEEVVRGGDRIEIERRVRERIISGDLRV